MIKLKEIESESKYIDFNNDIKVKTFLTIEEINEIVNRMISEEDPIKRMVIYYSSLVEFCTNIDLEQFKDENDFVKADEVYDCLAENQLLSLDFYIDNVSHIKEIMSKLESTYNVIKGAVSELSTNTDSTQLLKALSEATETLQNQQKVHQDIFK
jgi:hypothetical protein